MLNVVKEIPCIVDVEDVCHTVTAHVNATSVKKDCVAVADDTYVQLHHHASVTKHLCNVCHKGKLEFRLVFIINEFFIKSIFNDVVAFTDVSVSKGEIFHADVHCGCAVCHKEIKASFNCFKKFIESFDFNPCHFTQFLDVVCIVRLVDVDETVCSKTRKHLEGVVFTCNCSMGGKVVNGVVCGDNCTNV